MEYLTVVLRRNFENNAFMGGYTASWSSYQIELALEEMVYGHPCDNHYSASLGESAKHDPLPWFPRPGQI